NVFRGAAVRHWNEALLGTLLGATAALLLHLTLGAGRRQIAGLPAADRQALAIYVLGGVLTGAAQVLVVLSMLYIPVAIVSVITLCSPLLVIPASVFLLRNREGVSATTIAGALLALAGIGFIVLG